MDIIYLTEYKNDPIPRRKKNTHNGSNTGVGTSMCHDIILFFGVWVHGKAEGFSVLLSTIDMIVAQLIFLIFKNYHLH